ncbi:phosphotransferase enzyme family protein [Bacillus cereus group sp. BfR-BA-01380]|uniref:phosphotransferase enzyme family protein n=1 Tax=Bacillus cereus group sp. BfR-BA-01380 TaxID=2920324 RepID=UPI001F5A8BE1|nr:lipopolysaccharide core heptose(II) kinase RfaY [Bacillus cereus group sp. BfR-BA-01380]
MELAVEKVFTKEILQEAAKRFGVTVREEPLGDFENYIFRAEGEDCTSYVLRLTHSSHRTYKQIEAELDFLAYLGENGAKVAAPHRSQNDIFVESLQATDGTSFYVSLFDYANGERVKDVDSAVWNDTLFYAWGKAIGQLHRLTMDYPKTENRVTWMDDEITVIDMLQEDKELQAIAYEVVAEIKNSPVTNRTFGLIHGDIHHGNFHYENGELTIFDFDDATYNYFAHDLAMVLYYSALQKDWSEEEKAIFARHQLQVLREGYETEYILDDSVYDTIPLFMRLRDVALYGTIMKKFNGKAMPEHFQTLTNAIYKRIVARKAIVEW